MDPTISDLIERSINEYSEREALLRGQAAQMRAAAYDALSQADDAAASRAALERARDDLNAALGGTTPTPEESAP